MQKAPTRGDTLAEGQPHTLSGMDTCVMAVPIFAACINLCAHTNTVYSCLSSYMSASPRQSSEEQEIWGRIGNIFSWIKQNAGFNTKFLRFQWDVWFDVPIVPQCVWRNCSDVKNYEEEVQRKKRKHCSSNTFLNDPSFSWVNTKVHVHLCFRET